jgi:antibiotic biosynthesis monooxygenase (ABM) superfamily enzyme
MSAPGRVSADEQYKSVAFVITHTIKTGEEKRYEDWTKEILNASSSYPGYLGREVFRPAAGSRKYTTIVRFDRDEHLRAWIDSDTRRELIGRVSDLLEEGDQNEIRTGVDFWFTPEGTRSPKAWKQFLLTTSAVYPLSLIIPRLLAPLFRVVPPLGHQLVANLLVAIILTGLLTFVIMPRYTRLFRRWLYKGTE